jgi:tetratricopeptide (TPR) repeat protein
MKAKFSVILMLLINLFIPNGRIAACTIFMANDGHHVWVGNNEDESPVLTYRLWYYPAFHKDYGYMLWTELSDNESLNRMMYKNPQGGMNQYGLFMDYTAIAELPATKDPKKKDREEEVVTDVLKQCKTVAEALKYIAQFNLIRLTGAQLFIGDASGDYAVVHGGYVLNKQSKNFALTNYSVKNNYHEACWRRDAAIQYFDQNSTYSLTEIKDLLQKTSQKKPSNIISNYSMAADLPAKVIHLYYKNDFSTPRVISLEKELKKGKHYRDMAAYFPLSIKDIMVKKYTLGGINLVLSAYQTLRKNDPGKYNFKNNDALELAISAIAADQTKDAIRFLECLKSYDPNGIAINAWLGVAYRREGQTEKSNKCFASVLALDPNNYIATLFGKQKAHQVTFMMNDFQAAEQVFILADFSKWQAIPMKKEHGLWTCQIEVPPGEYNYKFLVNKEYLADQLNLLYTGSGEKIYSKLYVWPGD